MQIRIMFMNDQMDANVFFSGAKFPMYLGCTRTHTHTHTHTLHLQLQLQLHQHHRHRQPGQCTPALWPKKWRHNWRCIQRQLRGAKKTGCTPNPAWWAPGDQSMRGTRDTLTWGDIKGDMTRTLTHEQVQEKLDKRSLASKATDGILSYQCCNWGPSNREASNTWACWNKLGLC